MTSSSPPQHFTVKFRTTTVVDASRGGIAAGCPVKPIDFRTRRLQLTIVLHLLAALAAYLFEVQPSRRSPIHAATAPILFGCRAASREPVALRGACPGVDSMTSRRALRHLERRSDRFRQTLLKYLAASAFVAGFLSASLANITHVQSRSVSVGSLLPIREGAFFVGCATFDW